MTDSPVWVCPTCGAHHPQAERPPEQCAICVDERQWVPPSGQRWTTQSELAANGYAGEIREIEPGLTGLGVQPALGVGHRAVLVRTRQGNLLWDPPPFVDERIREAIRERGGLHTVTASHPHMYGALTQLAAEFDAQVLLPATDTGWLQRPSPGLRTWSGTSEPLPGVTLIQCGGHFPGSAVLHLPNDGGLLLCGDTVFVTPGEDRVTFMWSAPNRLPLPERETRAILETLRPYEFDRIYGGWWDPVIRADAKRILERSTERYLQFVRGDVRLG